jgi:phosphoglycerate dehydrogenase-like enzyme
VKRGVHLVNVSRGALVDLDALHDALDAGVVACASLDTVEPEPLRRVIGRMHTARPAVAAHLVEHGRRFEVLLESFVENLRRFRAGQPLDGEVDPTAGY